MSSTIGRASAASPKQHFTMIGHRAKKAVDEASERLSPLTLTVLFISPVVAAALFNVWIHVATIHLGYELSAEARIHESLVEENRGVRVEIATLKSPDRLKKLATETYQMGPPKAGQVIRVPKAVKQ